MPIRWGCRAAALAALFTVSASFAADPQPYERTIKVNVDDEKPLPVREVDVIYGGFVKLDALFSVYSDGDVATPGGIRDFYAPSSIPVAASSTAENATSMFDMHAKETRFFFKIDANVSDAKLGGYLEADFISNPGAGTEVVTNAYNPALRRAYITYNNWLFGQDWTTFQSLASLPDSLDFVRWPSEGTVFERQPVVRYTLPAVLGGEFQFALENAETFVRPRTGTGTATFVTGDSSLPDLVVRYNWKPSFGEIGVALLARELRADFAATGGAPPDDSASGKAVGMGLSIGGKLASFGKDDVRFMVTSGEGIGRYVALGAATDAVVDAGNELEPIAVTAAFVSYRRVWTERWRSNLAVAAFQADNDTALTGSGVTSSLSSGRINLIYAPVEKLSFGVEYTHGIRELENGEDGTLDRVQFSTMYAY
jgi:hypothetical protein